MLLKNDADDNGAERSRRSRCSRPPTQNRCAGERVEGTKDVVDEELDLGSVASEHVRHRARSSGSTDGESGDMYEWEAWPTRLALPEGVGRHGMSWEIWRQRLCRGTLFPASEAAPKRIPLSIVWDLAGSPPSSNRWMMRRVFESRRVADRKTSFAFVLGTPAAARAQTGASQGSGSMIKFYTDETPGLQISPVAVLVMSLGFIGFVTILHIVGKLVG